jgi:hypothetical protein
MCIDLEGDKCTHMHDTATRNLFIRVVDDLTLETIRSIPYEVQYYKKLLSSRGEIALGLKDVLFVEMRGGTQSYPRRVSGP